MSKIDDLIVKAVLPTFKAVGKEELESVLSGIREQYSPETYQAMLLGIYADFTRLNIEAEKSSFGPGGGIVSLVLEAVMERAAADGISLS